MLPQGSSECLDFSVAADDVLFQDHMDGVLREDQDLVLETPPYSPTLPYAESSAEGWRADLSDVSASPKDSPPKRRRLRVKQPALTSAEEVDGAEHSDPGAPHDVDDITETIFSKRPGRLTLSANDMLCLRNLLRRCVWRDLYDDTDMCRRGPEEKKRVVYKKCDKLNIGQKLAYLRRAEDLVIMSDADRLIAKKVIPSLVEYEETMNKEGRFIRAQAALLTYYSPEWTLRRAEWDVRAQDYRRLVTSCKEDDYVQGLWNTMVSDLNKLVHKVGVLFFTMALEICTQTFDMAGEIKLHAHLVLEFDGKKYIRNPMSMRLAGALPAHAREGEAGSSRCGAIMERRGMHCILFS